MKDESNKDYKKIDSGLPEDPFVSPEPIPPPELISKIIKPQISKFFSDTFTNKKIPL